ncbi:hypothetical protein BVU_0968 [Phocaeicola vulgatus ATCC 8482]|uniref:Uncharacterized protein n=1 Tax=Phocaeicola vulgatus (strain ATCC 8482 / DSM 1447 / JCM 5826 / CCUG 4940 / NBRC 14291 / NCTC 11154) TaxID=435590 RepID=A6KYZ9_PHOV8|nr:hypothetical protein BVU_0968 [Phocaeicola vulgatus ATCC 8482]
MIFLRISKFYHAIYQRVSFVLLLLKVVSGISVSRFSFFHGDFSTCPSFPPYVFPFSACHFFSWDGPPLKTPCSGHATLPFLTGGLRGSSP